MPFIPLKFIAVREKRDTSTLKLCTSLVRLSHQKNWFVIRTILGALIIAASTTLHCNLCITIRKI